MIDTAIRELSGERNDGGRAPRTATSFKPFDPTAKMAEATAIDQGREIRIVKGAPAAVSVFAPIGEGTAEQLEALDRAGYRTLAVAAGPDGALELIGLIALGDPPRPDSAQLLTELRSLGVIPIMVTGDAQTTASTVAHSIGLDGPVCPPGAIPERVGPGDLPSMRECFPSRNFSWSRLPTRRSRRRHVRRRRQ